MTTTLPASRREVPDALAEYRVTGMKQMQTHDGVAFNATLRRGRKIVGTIENEGRGGGTWTRIADRDVRADFEAAVEACREHEAEFPDFIAEIAPEWLIDEYEAAKALNRSLKKGQTSVIPTDASVPVVEWTVYPTADTEGIAQRLAADGQQVLIWNGEEWAS